MKVTIKKECVKDINEVMETPAPWSLEDIREFQKTVCAKHELDVVETFEDSYEVHDWHLQLNFFLLKNEAVEVLEDDYMLLVKDRRQFIDKYNVKLWNGDKCLCHYVRETKDTITVIGDQCGVEEPPIQKTIIVNKEDIEKHWRGTPMLNVIVIE